jgi:hypothetical protein
LLDLATWNSCYRCYYLVQILLECGHLVQAGRRPADQQKRVEPADSDTSSFIKNSQLAPY